MRKWKGSEREKGKLSPLSNLRCHSASLTPFPPWNSLAEWRKEQTAPISCASRDSSRCARSQLCFSHRNLQPDVHTQLEASPKIIAISTSLPAQRSGISSGSPQNKLPHENPGKKPFLWPKPEVMRRVPHENPGKEHFLWPKKEGMRVPHLVCISRCMWEILSAAEGSRVGDFMEPGVLS